MMRRSLVRETFDGLSHEADIMCLATRCSIVDLSRTPWFVLIASGWQSCVYEDRKDRPDWWMPGAPAPAIHELVLQWSMSMTAGAGALSGMAILIRSLQVFSLDKCMFGCLIIIGSTHLNTGGIL